MKKFMMLVLVSLFGFGCSNSKSVKVLGPNNEVVSEHDRVSGWGSSADMTKLYQGRDFDRCMYYMQGGIPSEYHNEDKKSLPRPGLDARSAYQYCSSGGVGMPGMLGGYTGGTRGYVPGGGRANVTVIPDYAPGTQTLPRDAGIDPATIVTRDQYNADMKRVGDAITEERDQREQDKKKKK